jgi:CheY-like chemotaxis protein
MIDNAVKLIDALARFFAGIGWPLVCIIAVLWLAPALRDLISRINNFSGKGVGIEFNIVAEQRRDAANQLVAAKIDQAKTQVGSAQLQNTSSRTPILNNQFDKFLKEALETTSNIQIDRTTGRQLLWVDDNPSNNIYERQSLSALGIRITSAISTEAALALLKTQHYDVIVSDMKRGQDGQAGYELLAKVREAGNTVPLIFYTSSATPDLVKEAKDRGAYGETNSPDNLITLVTSALGAK